MTVEEMYSIIKKMPIEKQILILKGVNFLIDQSKLQQKRASHRKET
jgi:hypothetical protein